ncbi:MAG: ribosome silencing factor [Betaproteobacteria bacterium]|nr:ribosome silencing factor [Betaproteobacteria bacterium]MDE2622073.1 ribosome silencing factor [Betaproteobacteria bacterium]
MDSLRVKDEVVLALEDIKARDIEVLDVRKLTSICDYMVIASADSTRQTKALARNVEDRLSLLGLPIQGPEGLSGGEWILVDAGSVIVHIMQPAVREYYNLSELWGGVTVQPRRAANG